MQKLKRKPSMVRVLLQGCWSVPVARGSSPCCYGQQSPLLDWQSLLLGAAKPLLLEWAVPVTRTDGPCCQS